MGKSQEGKSSSEEAAKAAARGMARGLNYGDFVGKVKAVHKGDKSRTIVTIRVERD